jgi:hypothetical protein
MKPDPSEWQKFLQSEAPLDAAAPVPNRIEKDLVASRWKLSSTYIGGAALGYLISLMICAQCSIGLSPLAWKINSLIHTMPDPWCPLLCGFIFGFSPTLVSFLYLSRFQHRYLIFRMGWLPALVPLISSALMLLSDDPHGWMWRSIWLTAAILTPYMIELIAALVLKQARWKPETTRLT